MIRNLKQASSAMKFDGNSVLLKKVLSRSEVEEGRKQVGDLFTCEIFGEPTTSAGS